MTDDFLDFVLVAASRSGTTWLSAALSEHPEIWIPQVKELNFFNEPYLNHLEFKYERGIEYYKEQFEEAPADAISGELTPAYFVDLNSAKRIHEHFPETKILILLRNPADVVHSTYLKSSEYYPTADDLETEIENRPELLDLGYYYRNLKPYFDLFPKDHIYVGIYEHFFADLARNVAQVYEFLGADAGFAPSALTRKINRRRSIRWPVLVKMRHALRRVVNMSLFLPLKRLLTRASFIDMLDKKLTELNLAHGQLPELSPETRSWLDGQFADDQEKLADLVGLDLSIWKK